MADASGSFSAFQTLLTKIGNTAKHTDKTTVIRYHRYAVRGTSLTFSNFLSTFKGDVYLLFKLILCREDKRPYNIRERGFVKILTALLGCEEEEMVTDLEKGDIGETNAKVCAGVLVFVGLCFLTEFFGSFLKHRGRRKKLAH